MVVTGFLFNYHILRLKCFAEKCESWRLKSCYLPMKIGGKPAWMDLKNIPSAKDVVCEICNDPCIFLCQIYAPDEQNDEAFHRSLFLFICRKAQCCKQNSNKNLKIFRSQLPRDNEYYPAEPVDFDKKNPHDNLEASYWIKVCRVCNIKSPSHCKKCQKVNYCCRQHQILDWEAGHKKVCAKLADGEKIELPDETYERFLFPEYEIDYDEECPDDDNDDDDDNGDDKEKVELDKFNKMVEEGSAGSLQHIKESDLIEMVKANDDEVFMKFKEKIKNNPDQILRYHRGGQPLYISKNNKVKGIPTCENCNGERTFEFQLMPQLLNYLNCNDIGSIDWGVLIIFTCKNSCSIVGYQPEFIWKQDIETV
ncbi:programmed cell death protein 2 [Microplitis demolitor]|uniref:programmed cell death protein 2 n=1 Tax=Microplitis demolitor TaxID=69319 RepID=UPI00235B6D6B|nr:programmed cell death protein 2 [Microplitis demolitor]